jgi:hypothetical protein
MPPNRKIVLAFANSWFAAGSISAQPANIGSLIIGPGATSSFVWQINNATGTAWSEVNPPSVVSGWSQIQVHQIFNPLTGQTSPGSLTWTATPTAGNQFQFAVQTLLNPTTIGSDNPGPMANFNPAQSYMWPFVSYQGNYAGPLLDSTLTADTIFDASQFANPIQGTFSLHLDQTSHLLDIVYTTPVPESGTLGLVTLGLLGVWRAAFRRTAG